MQITPIDFTFNSADANMDHSERSVGCHVSKIIKSLEKKYGRLAGRKDVDDDNQEQWKDYRLAGFVMERAFKEVVAESTKLKLIRPGELCVDNIYMTPDFLDVEGWAVEEWKCTWRSMSWDIDDMAQFFSWWAQIKAYCRALGVLKARLRVFYVNGDYRPRKPQPRAWEITFEPWELDENWQMILQHAKEEGMI